VNNPINVARILDEGTLGPYRFLIALLCALCLVMDGFDAQAMGYVAPTVIREWHIAKEALSPVFSASLLGMLAGSLIFSTLADKVGRRPVLVGATLQFSGCMMATGFAQSIETLIGWRFAAGLGLGAIMPNAMALAGEYSPRRIRVSLMMIVSCGYALGGVVGGLVSAALIPAFGWRSVFIAGGVVPVVIGVVMLVWLPESIQFLLSRGQNEAVRERVRRQLSRLVRDANAYDLTGDVRFATPSHAPASKLPFVDLFRDGRGRVTLLLWLVNFANLLDMYFLSNWLPTVLREAGYSASMAVVAGSVLWGGGVLGTLFLGPLIDRFGFARVLGTIFVIAIVTIAAIGNPAVIGVTAAMLASVFLTGVAIIGGQPGINALAATYYPTTLRSTGIGWSLGMGRFGSVIGPLLGGVLLHFDWSVQAVFMAASIPAFVSLVSIIMIHRSTHESVWVAN
jgi:MFS transporter, AAHS family, 4-hydroxybenzoate transporter